MTRASSIVAFMRSSAGRLGVLLLTLLLLSPAALAHAQGDRSVTLGHVSGWTGLNVKNEVLSQVLEHLGYDVERFPASLPLVYSGVASGDIDAFAGVWIPSSQSMIEPHYDDGTVTLAGTHLDGARYGTAVPQHVCDEGITSFADLDEHADRFDHEYFGLEPGNDGNELILEAIEQDTYGLGDWNLVESSISAMLTRVESAIEDGEPVVFSAWIPHWMNVVYDLCYLEDPENVWGGGSRVDTIVNTAYADAHPNVARFLEQFSIEPEMQSQWILEYGFEERPADVVAAEWIRENPDVVSAWLEGVTTVEGADGADAVRTAIEE